MKEAPVLERKGVAVEDQYDDDNDDDVDAKTAATKPTEHTPSASAGLKGDISIIISDKLPNNKFLMELTASDDHEHVIDLAGDAGAVGRLIIGQQDSAGSSSDNTFKIDLKGVLYNASILPLAGTALILNLGVSEAKVEAIMHDFIQLREDATLLASEEAMEGYMDDLAVMGSDDDEVYQVQPAEGGAAADGVADNETSKKRNLKKDVKGKASASKNPARQSRTTAPSSNLKVRKKPTAKKAKPRDKGVKSLTARKPGTAGTAGGNLKQGTSKSATLKDMADEPKAKKAAGKKLPQKINNAVDDSDDVDSDSVMQSDEDDDDYDSGS
ncbi:hypothetical protein CEUSTIGMA_g11719.t1 [Chlamydomonas eustigma]|uniref:Uncharacterized protein n=1 Tax=Chlamydomonas eustigma TaxID=1157962 RepID=A0A250XMJ8_9CHLO|nr:hypothetical protein CEUSTIGMA_g11719.t1 [Chlamydomonas eustigma]|eukprot:GAX84297.1 hypothetical protein CEUSTIGMA_g11719.t1 [Chlamydomonas eustigma]